MITNCRSCGSGLLNSVIDLGFQSISRFDETPEKPIAYPLELVVCESCTLAQLSHTAPPDDLFNDTYSFKSGVNEGIRNNLKQVVDHALMYRPNPSNWLDIASNDGTLLSFVPQDVYRVGIDPLKQFADEARQHADEIIVNFFDPYYFGKQGDTFDIITSVSMFYDLDNPNEFVAGVKESLTDGGVWVIQHNYLPTMLANTSVDNLSHEHLTYWSLESLAPLLARHGLVIIDCVLDPINGGCFRTVIKHASSASRGTSEYTDAPSAADYEGFADRAERLLVDLKALVSDINAKGENVWIYGASTRGAVLWQGAGLTANDVPYAVERNPDKVGKYFNAIGSKIISEDDMRADPPEYLLCGLYWLRDLIVEREAEYLANGGKLIFPVPELEIVG